MHAGSHPGATSFPEMDSVPSSDDGCLSSSTAEPRPVSEARSLPKCNSASLHLLKTKNKNASRSSPGSRSDIDGSASLPHPPALYNEKPASNAYRSILPCLPLRIGVSDAETSGCILPIRSPLLPNLISPPAILNTSPQIASSVSPVVSPSVSSVTSIKATSNRTVYVLLTLILSFHAPCSLTW